MGVGLKGKWVFVPPGHTVAVNPPPHPPEFYCLKRSQIVCRLYLRDIRPDLFDYCVENLVLPPERLRKWRLEKWIEDHRTAAAAVVPIEELRAKASRRSDRGRPQQGRGAVAIESAIERRSFFLQLAQASQEATR
jgi:hypothetical protein